MTKLYIISILTCLGFSCQKDPMIPSDNIYIGTMVKSYQSANSYQGYSKWDTSYIDTIEVEYNHDSIFFLNKEIKRKFKWNSSGSYMELYGTNSYSKFNFSKKNDSLQYSYWVYGGYSSSFNQKNVVFKGKK